MASAWASGLVQVLEPKAYQYSPAFGLAASETLIGNLRRATGPTGDLARALYASNGQVPFTRSGKICGLQEYVLPANFERLYDFFFGDVDITMKIN